MRRLAFALVALSLSLGACVQSAPTPRPLPAAAPGEREAGTPPISYLEDVKPILDRRCVVCHSCYNAPCQLKLSSYEGIDRGASKAPVYSSTRLRAQDPTRLFMDAETTEGWRRLGFSSVIENGPGDLEAPILLALLEAKREQPVLPGEYHPEAADLTCAADRRELDAFLREHPERGMPFGFPALSLEEHATIAAWLRQGAPGPTADEQRARVSPSAGAARQLARWEEFLNRDDAKHAVTARYLYEHFFLAHVRFTEGGAGEFYELVRSATPPGEPVSPIATRRPYDAPGVDAVFYRFRRLHSTPVHKTHMVVEFDDARLARYRELFIATEWLETPHRVAFDEETAGNPFLVHAQIPPGSRYRFLLDDAHFFVDTFIRGPVCKGQIALNVIHDHFWVLFLDPDADRTLQHPEFLVEQAENLALPDERGSNERLIRAFSDAYRSRYRNFYRAKMTLYEREEPEGFGLEAIWKGRRPSDAPLLTVYRHFDSASVHRGALGDLPRTSWVIDYPQFERIYYALVAGFDVFGNVAHQVNVRRYMDFLRVEGELNFIEFLPRERRLPTLRSWYQGDRAIENVDPDAVLSSRGTRVAYRTDRPEQELFERVVDEHLLRSARLTFDPINYHRGHGAPPMPSSFATREDVLDGFRALTAPGTGFIRHVTSSSGNVLFTRLRDFEGNDHFFTIVINRWHDNVNTMFDEEDRLDPSKDTIDFIPGSIGSYPNYFLLVDAKDLPDFFDVLQNFDGSEAYVEKFRGFGVNRSDPRFWDTYDWFQRQQGHADPSNAGLYDLNRYYPVALGR